MTNMNSAQLRDTARISTPFQFNGLEAGTGHKFPRCASELEANMRREAQAYALTEALLNCDRDDRVPFLESILDGLRAGMPIPLFGKIMAEASFWAGEASRAELKAYCAACYARLTPEDQAAFRSFIDGRAAA
ncbi:MAG: hypothetical protein ACK4GT_19725 [Pararhodobacter sp.]